jgi:hypothetical protein
MKGVSILYIYKCFWLMILYVSLLMIGALNPSVAYSQSFRAISSPSLSLKVQDAHILGIVELGSNPYNSNIGGKIYLEDVTVVVKEYWYVWDGSEFKKPHGRTSKTFYGFFKLFAPGKGELEQGRVLASTTLNDDGSFDLVLQDEVPLFVTEFAPKVPWIKGVTLEDEFRSEEVTAHRSLEVEFINNKGAAFIPDVQVVIQFFGQEDIKNLGVIKLDWIYLAD